MLEDQGQVMLEGWGQVVLEGREPGWLAGGGKCLQVAEKQKMMEIISPTYSVRKLIFC